MEISWRTVDILKHSLQRIEVSLAKKGLSSDAALIRETIIRIEEAILDEDDRDIHSPPSCS